MQTKQETLRNALGSYYDLIRKDDPSFYEKGWLEQEQANVKKLIEENKETK